MRKIDCAHSRSVKTLPWPWFREGIGVLKRKSNIFGFLWENRRFLGFSRRGIARIPESWKRFLNSDSGKKSMYWSENQFIYVNTYPFPESGSRKRFHGSGMRAIDSPPRKTYESTGFLIKIRKYLIFASIHTPHSLNQGQGSIFTLQECKVYPPLS